MVEVGVGRGVVRVVMETLDGFTIEAVEPPRTAPTPTPTPPSGGRPTVVTLTPPPLPLPPESAVAVVDVDVKGGGGRVRGNMVEATAALEADGVTAEVAKGLLGNGDVD